MMCAAKYMDRLIASKDKVVMFGVVEKA